MLREGSAEVCDGIDNDLDGFTDEGFIDSDFDGLADCVDPDDDNDGFSDEDEVLAGSDPLDPGSVPPPIFRVGQLISRVGDLVALDEISANRANGLDAILNATLRSLLRDNTSAAVHQLEAFKIQVGVLVSGGSLSPELGEELTSEVDSIIGDL